MLSVPPASTVSGAPELITLLLVVKTVTPLPISRPVSNCTPLCIATAVAGYCVILPLTRTRLPLPLTTDAEPPPNPKTGTIALLVEG